MKCIQYFRPHIRNGVQFDRVPDDIAESAVSFGVAMYCPKRLWKKHVRDAADAVAE